MPDAKPSKQTERQERLAAELRANLKKRKAQLRARHHPNTAASDADATPSTGLHRPDPSAKG